MTADDVLDCLQQSTQAMNEGRHELGVDLAMRAAEGARAQGDLVNLGRALADLAAHRLRVGDLVGVLRDGPPALELLADERLCVTKSRLLNTLTLACLNAGLIEIGLRYGQQALDEAHDPISQAWALSRMGSIHHELGNLERSLDEQDRALELARGLGDAELLFAALNNLAETVIKFAKLRQAAGEDVMPLRARSLELTSEALVVAEGNVHRMALGRLNYAEALYALGQPEEARAALEASATLAGAHGLTDLWMLAYAQRAELLLGSGEAEAAYAELAQALATLPADDRASHRERFHELMYRASKCQGRFEAALAHHEQFHALRHASAEARFALQARVMINQHDLDQARHVGERARLDAEMQRLRAEQLDRAAHTDALTGLYNRHYLGAQLRPLQERAAREHRGLWAALIDVDHFKAINDRLGHALGDAVLKALAQLIAHQTRGSDLAVRYGGDEFLLLLIDTGAAHAREVAERLRAQVQAHAWGEIAPGMTVTVSVGLGPLGLHEAEASELLAPMDAALYAAKRAGRNQVRLA